ncbi:MAG: hypothetical protein LBK74_00415 [Treponema sp.]|jgi:hypothetical protein|nr:hypothetical protein [Treponema sp.]
MPQFMYDALNSFGSATLASDTAFPDTIDLGDADISRMTVDIKCPAADAAGGTSIAVSVAGSNDSAFATTETIGSRTLTLAAVNKSDARIAINPNRYRYVKVTFTKTGTFTAGTVQAFINTYLGK